MAAAPPDAPQHRPFRQRATAMTAGIVAPHVLRQYALLADGHRGALIGPRGDISWMCAPRWEDDGVFATLIAPPNVTSRDGSLVNRHDGLVGVVFLVCLARVFAGGVTRPHDVASGCADAGGYACRPPPRPRLYRVVAIVSAG